MRADFNSESLEKVKIRYYGAERTVLEAAVPKRPPALRLPGRVPNIGTSGLMAWTITSATFGFFSSMPRADKYVTR